MAFKLPIVATVTESGVTFRVRALPWGLAREFARPDADNFALGAKVYERCVEAEDGDGHPAKPDLDDLPASLVARFAQLASATRADGPAANPPSPPSSTARGSGG